MTHLHLVRANGKLLAKRGARRKEVLECKRCGSRQVVKVTTGASIDTSKVLRGGGSVYACFACALKGDYTVIA